MKAVDFALDKYVDDDGNEYIPMELILSKKVSKEMSMRD
jgi:hypothetical protein